MKAILALGLAATAAAVPVSSGCPVDLDGPYAAPNLIVPVDSSQPDHSFGTKYTGNITKTISNLFHFSLPGNFSGKTCSLMLQLPKNPNLWDLSGDGVLHTTSLQNQVTNGTTWASKGPVQQDLDKITVAEGFAYRLDSFACPSGQDGDKNMELSYEIASTDDKTTLTWFETDPHPPSEANQQTGLWIRAC